MATEGGSKRVRRGCAWCGKKVDPGYDHCSEECFEKYEGAKRSRPVTPARQSSNEEWFRDFAQKREVEQAIVDRRARLTIDGLLDELREVIMDASQEDLDAAKIRYDQLLEANRARLGGTDRDMGNRFPMSRSPFFDGCARSVVSLLLDDYRAKLLGVLAGRPLPICQCGHSQSLHVAPFSGGCFGCARGPGWCSGFEVKA